jgi:hypothetical protein
MSTIVNPLTGRQIKVNGRTFKNLEKMQQDGGNPILAALPPLKALIVPGALAAASIYAPKFLGKEKKQSGGNPIMAALPAVKDLIVPGVLSAASIYAPSYFPKEKKQSGGKLSQRRKNLRK